MAKPTRQFGWPALPQTIQTGEWSDDTLALRMKMAERRGHAPHAAWWRHNLVSKESRHAGPVDVPLGQGVMPSRHQHDGKMPSLLESGTPGRTLPLLRLCIFCSAPHECALSRKALTLNLCVRSAVLYD